jgi:hypothetical protein
VLTASVPSNCLHPPSAIFMTCPASLHTMPCQPQQDVFGVVVLGLTSCSSAVLHVSRSSCPVPRRLCTFNLEWCMSQRAQRKAHLLECPGLGGSGPGPGGAGVGGEGRPLTLTARYDAHVTGPVMRHTGDPGLPQHGVEHVLGKVAPQIAKEQHVLFPAAAAVCAGQVPQQVIAKVRPGKGIMRCPGLGGAGGAIVVQLPKKRRMSSFGAHQAEYSSTSTL